jgi:S1-C subfamily serine protease
LIQDSRRRREATAQTIRAVEESNRLANAQRDAELRRIRKAEEERLRAAEHAAAESRRLADAQRDAEVRQSQIAEAERIRLETERKRQDEKDRLAREEEAKRVLTPEQIVARSEKSVALIKTSDGSGTGFVVAAGIVLTNYHVVRSSSLDGIEVFFPSVAKNRSIKVSSILYISRSHDIAALRIEPSQCPIPLPLADVAEFRRGRSVTVIGNPGFGDGTVLENAVSVGVMSSQLKIRGVDYNQLSIGINPGNSGGPVFDTAGRVIGIVTMKARKQENIAFCTTLENMRAAVIGSLGQTAPGSHRLRSEMEAESMFRRTEQLCDLYVLGRVSKQCIAPKVPVPQGGGHKWTDTPTT